jgi:hypothetical protein
MNTDNSPKIHKGISLAKQILIISFFSSFLIYFLFTEQFENKVKKEGIETVAQVLSTNFSYDYRNINAKIVFYTDKLEKKYAVVEIPSNMFGVKPLSYIKIKYLKDDTSTVMSKDFLEEYSPSGYNTMKFVFTVLFMAFMAGLISNFQSINSKRGQFKK